MQEVGISSFRIQRKWSKANGMQDFLLEINQSVYSAYKSFFTDPSHMNVQHTQTYHFSASDIQRKVDFSFQWLEFHRMFII